MNPFKPVVEEDDQPAPPEHSNGAADPHTAPGSKSELEMKEKYIKTANWCMPNAEPTVNINHYSFTDQHGNPYNLEDFETSKLALCLHGTVLPWNTLRYGDRVRNVHVTQWYISSRFITQYYLT